jgi:hypothetical protein
MPQPIERRGATPPPVPGPGGRHDRVEARRRGRHQPDPQELGVSERALRNAWCHHGLGLPPRPDTRPPHPTNPPLGQAFLALNPWLVLPAAQQYARLRRAEEVKTLGVAAVTELTADSRWPRPAARLWAITRRAQRAERLAHEHTTPSRPHAPASYPPALLPEGRSPARQVSEAATGLPATGCCRRRGRHALDGGPAGPGSTGPSPSGPGGGVAPAPRFPAAAPASPRRRGPLLLARCGACPRP